ncbi:hypothetical protein EVB32_202 [Rhizobium phage RHph_TM39]|uniref:DUF3307 domain-containing protein n=2 Tax=Cuauhnahuacvirus TaxID=3044696 RepID=A0A7S5R7Z2_9CAUD|nr:membrane protein [Rhizobium phage RHph_TM30]YP_010671361.1 membrane protein [Rhizobium phage RHph_Y65]QIG71682.1 hypothetical protein EVB94_211 [Rhizobium phage RHph_TM40]QIG72045.1 hypothetical protein EVB95_211 [Rhizobium phage RHph_TM2_3B]QIG72408.1 hypothetical protein EVB96_212 [Rhizobium phage RHph_TM3_3_6]QIG77190.1 hypothetical protein EVB32_202 [Rhizobium phage RHph_TM39]QIG77798.1 hypothetical protein EVB64_211 [Rhizobium phage RHph_TM61]
MEFGLLLFKLLVGHAIWDYPGQGFLADLKNCNKDCKSLLKSNFAVDKHAWMFGLFFHVLLHCGAVAFITQSVTATILEFVVHIITDHVKCKDKISFVTDQIIHILTKVVICIIVLHGGFP